MKEREYKVTYTYIDADGVPHGCEEYVTADSFDDARHSVMFDIATAFTDVFGICQVQNAIMVFTRQELYRFYYDFYASYAD